MLYTIETMNDTLFLNQKFIRIVFAATALFLVLAVSMMILNLHKVEKRLNESSIGSQAVSSAKPISREKYDRLITGFKEQYSPVSVHKRNVFSQSTDEETVVPQIEIPSPAVDFSDLRNRLIISKIYKKPVKLLFKGYIQQADEVYVSTINWAGKTDFKKVGDTIRGYKVVDFQKRVSEQKTLWGGAEKIDQSIVTLERENGERFNLEMGKIALEKEIYAEIWDRKEVKSCEVYVGADILDNKVLDITSSGVIIISPKGEKISLIRNPGKE